MSTKDVLLVFNCLKWSKNHKKHFNKYVIKTFGNTYEFCDREINKFCLMLRKGIYRNICIAVHISTRIHLYEYMYTYTYEYMDSWKISNETLLPDKNITDITRHYR